MPVGVTFTNRDVLSKELILTSWEKFRNNW